MTHLYRSVYATLRSYVMKVVPVNTRYGKIGIGDNLLYILCLINFREAVKRSKVNPLVIKKVIV